MKRMGYSNEGHIEEERYSIWTIQTGYILSHKGLCKTITEHKLKERMHQVSKKIVYTYILDKVKKKFIASNKPTNTPTLVRIYFLRYNKICLKHMHF